MTAAAFLHNRNSLLNGTGSLKKADDYHRIGEVRNIHRCNHRRSRKPLLRKHQNCSNTLVPEECEQFSADLAAAGLDLIFLLAPTSTAQRMAQVGRIATGYVYYVSLKGVTGAGHLDTAAVAEAVPRIRAHVKVPVGVGFGIRDAVTAQAVAKVSDAVVIGSRLVQILHAEGRETAAAAGKAFMAEIRSAIDTL